MKCKNCERLEQEVLNYSSTYEVLKGEELIRYFKKKGYKDVLLAVESNKANDRFYLIEGKNNRGHKLVKKASSLSELEYKVFLEDEREIL